MIAPVENTFPVQQGVDPEYLVNVLTKDITTLESIFELVDNAVDAARDRLLEDGRTELDKYGLPSRYDGNQIEIKFGKKSVEFIDNCSGIPEDVLKDRAFVIGAMSHHAYGIGRFGIGLKRALFRLGTKYTLRTDTGKFAAKMHFDSKHLGHSDSALNATRYNSRGKAMTFVRVSGLREGVLHEFSASSWISDLSTLLSRRYGLYVAKGFKILINEQPIASFGPGVRSVARVKEQANNFMATENVRVFIDSGMHNDYRLKYESDYNSQKVASLTDQYGWYFVCNDRIVEVASHDRALGWTTKWHQEYYGFIGWVRFIAQDAENLPWDTKKSTIDPHSVVFRAIFGHLQQFAEKYKTQIKQTRKLQGVPSDAEGNNEPDASTKPSNTTSSAHSGKPTTNASPNGSGSNKPSMNDHNENWRTLLPPLAVVVKHQKIKALIYEAAMLDIKMCYSASMLFRAIVEMVLFEHLKLTRSFRLVRQMVFDQAAKDGRIFTEDQKKKFRPNFSQALEWLNKHDDYFPEEVRRDCVIARNKFGKHLKELNGVVHEGDLTNSSKLAIVRDDTMPLLQFLLIGI
jgi:hypothetical protein